MLAFTYSIPQIVISILVLYVTVWLIKYVRKISQLPPGPWGLPIVGYVPWLGENIHLTLTELGKKYGSMTSVNVGKETLVVLNDWPAIKATLVDLPKDFDGRPQAKNHIAALIKRKDVGLSDGPIWVKQRKLVVRCLREIGMGKRSMEAIIMDILHTIINGIVGNEGKNTEIKSLFFKPILQMNWNLVASEKLSDKELSEFENDIWIISQGFGNGHILHAFPWLRHFPPNGFGFKEMSKCNTHMMEHFKKSIENHKSVSTENADNDFIDLYLHAIEAAEATSKPANPPYRNEHLMATLWDLFIAGVETTNSTTLWGFLFIAYHPEVQKKIHDEMDLVVGRQRLPTLDDMPRLQYLSATIMEIHRLACVAPLSLKHRATNTNKIFGYTIPKNTTLLQNIFAVHHDPTLWDQPEEFRPERFLDEKNNAVWPPYLMPFSTGARMCIGQGISDMELKLTFGCLLHKFDIHLPKGLPKPSLVPMIGITMKPKPYSLQFVIRGDN